MELEHEIDEQDIRGISRVPCQRRNVFQAEDLFFCFFQGVRAKFLFFKFFDCLHSLSLREIDGWLVPA
jgi:hypothetical protein